MAVFTLPEELALQLETIAQRENRPPEAVLQTMFAQYTAVVEADTSQPDLLSALAQLADELNIDSGRSDISENFDDTLRQLTRKRMAARYDRDTEG